MKYVFRRKIWSAAAGALDAAGAVFFTPFSKSPDVTADKAESVLLLRLDHIGDALAATAYPKLIKENFRTARVIVVVSSQSAPLFENNPFVDEIIAYDASWFAAGRYKRKPGGYTFTTLKASLRARKIDVGISLRGDLRENYLLWAAGVKTRVGYGVTGGGFFLNRELPYRDDAHESVRSLDLFRAIGVHADKAVPALYFTDSERAAFTARRTEWGLGGDKIAIFQVAAGTPSKEWPIDSVNLFMISFATRFPGWRFVIAGTDTRTIHPLAGVVDLRGRTTLRELALLSAASSIFIGPDSGPAHLASAMGTPTVFLYSGTNDFARWKPLSENAVVLRNPTPCTPCGLRECVVAGHPCMSGLSVQSALDAVGKILEWS